MESLSTLLNKEGNSKKYAFDKQKVKAFAEREIEELQVTFSDAVIYCISELQCNSSKSLSIRDIFDTVNNLLYSLIQQNVIPGQQFLAISELVRYVCSQSYAIITIHNSQSIDVSPDFLYNADTLDGFYVDLSRPLSQSETLLQQCGTVAKALRKLFGDTQKT